MNGEGDDGDVGGEPSARSSAIGWQRVHPLTPLVRLWQAIVVVAVVAAQEWGRQVTTESSGASVDDLSGASSRFLFGGGAAVTGVVVMVTLGMALSWWFTRFRVTADTLELHYGIITRHQRHARLVRLQAVDVVRPFVPRLFGLAKLKVEVAGGSDSRIELAYLPRNQAVRLRAQLLELASELRDGPSPDVTSEGPDEPAAEDTRITVPLQRLLASLILDWSGLWLLAVFLVSLVASTTGGVRLFFTIAVPAGLPGAALLWKKVNSGFGFRVANSPDGIRLRHGLLEERHQTIPPNRVQAVRLSQPLLWRWADWWQAEVNVAGYGKAGREVDTEHVVLPVGTRAQVMTVLSFAVPEMGAENGDPERTQSLIDAGLTGLGDGEGFRTDPREAVWLSPLTWRRNGFRATSEVLLLRRGWARRVLDVVPHARTQSCGVRQGPVQRAFGVASFRLHSTPGPVSAQVPHLRVGDAAELLSAQVVRAHRARIEGG